MQTAARRLARSTVLVRTPAESVTTAASHRYHLRAMSRDPALRELLDDLRHDLAKYLRLPLRLLPHDADAELVRDAVERSLLRTQHTAAGTRSARDIYAERRAALAGASADAGRLRALDAAMQKAFAWELALVGGSPIDRAEIDRDFDAVARVIDDWLTEVSGD